MLRCAYYYTCVLILLYLCAHTGNVSCVQIQGDTHSPQISQSIYSAQYIALTIERCVRCKQFQWFTPSCVCLAPARCAYYYMCVLILLYVCPQTTDYMSPHSSSARCMQTQWFVLILLCMCSHTTHAHSSSVRCMQIEWFTPAPVWPARAALTRYSIYLLLQVQKYKY